MCSIGRLLSTHFRPPKRVSNWRGIWTCLLERCKSGWRMSLSTPRVFIDYSFRFQNKRQKTRGRQGERNPINPPTGQVIATLPTDTPPVVIHRRGGGPPPVSPTMIGESSHRSCFPLPATMSSWQTPPPHSGRRRTDIDLRRHWTGRSGPNRG